jgi:hypothetical protein
MVVASGTGAQRRVLQLPLTLPGMGAGTVDEKVAMFPALLPLALTFPLLLLLSVTMALPLLPVFVLLPVLPLPLLSAMSLALPPPHAATRRNAQAAAVARNAAFRFTPGLWSTAAAANYLGSAANDPRKGLSSDSD